MSFAPFNSHSSSYFHDYNILKFCDIITIEACAFINNCFNSNTFSVFAERFKLISESHAHNTRSSSKSLLFVPSYNTSRFGRKSIICSATLIWNHLQNKYSNHDFMKLAPKALKKFVTQKSVSLYCGYCSNTLLLSGSVCLSLSVSVCLSVSVSVSLFFFSLLPFLFLIIILLLLLLLLLSLLFLS